MAQIHSFFNSTFKELSNDTSHAQIRVETRKLWPRQVGEEKQVAEHKLCRDKASNKASEKAKDKLCCKKVFLCRNKVLENLSKTLLR